LIDEVRVSGFLQSAIERGGAIGVAVAPAGLKAGCPGLATNANSRARSHNRRGQVANEDAAPCGSPAA
jgi:hypothetical protein